MHEVASELYTFQQTPRPGPYTQTSNFDFISGNHCVPSQERITGIASSFEYSEVGRDCTQLGITITTDPNENYNPTQNPYPQNGSGQMKNVHFSPVVSQLRYPPSDQEPRVSRRVPCQPTQFGHCSDIPCAQHPSENVDVGDSSCIKKVKVQVQQIEEPVHQWVQRIQISVPHHNGQGLETLSVDFSDTKGKVDSHNLNGSKQEELFSNTIANQFTIDEISESSLANEWFLNHSLEKPLHIPQASTAGVDGNFGVYPTADNLNRKGTKTAAAFQHVNVHNSPKLFQESPSSCVSDDKLNNFRICEDSKTALQKMSEAKMHLSSSSGRDRLYETDDVLGINNLDVLISTPSDCKHVLTNANLGSLETLDIDDDNIPTRKTKRDTNTVDSDNNAVSCSNSWPSAYRKLKEKSKPKLNFLRRLTFGRFGGNRVSDKDKDGVIKNSKKSHKRSSCPPLGHPILLMSPSGIEDTALMNDLNSSENSKIVKSDNTSDENIDIAPDFLRNDCRSVDPRIYNNTHCQDKGYNNKYNSNGGKEQEQSEHIYLKTTNITVSSDLPPKPHPRVKTTSCALSKVKPGQNEQCHPDELSVKFERILEGILDLECDMMDGKENKPLNPFQGIHLNNEFVYGDDEVDCAYHRHPVEIDFIPAAKTKGEINTDHGFNYSSNNDSSQVIHMTEDKPSTPVVGKPPKPPSSASRLGMRTGASERFSYLKGRMSATATTETRLTMELAAKLCEFREELHRSREEIAKSHPNLDDIEKSVRISMAIDRAQRTLPQSRNHTTCSLPPVPLKTDGIGHGKTSSSSAEEPVKPVTEIIREEWDSVVLRAKENFSRSHQHNNGKSDPSESRGIVLETDLDTGASRAFPVDNSFSYGDSIRRRDLEKVLKAEDFISPIVQRNSCSLQNLSLVSTSEMATLAPCEPGGKEDRSRSMEFLVDDSNKNAHLMPPENTLMKNQDTRRMSEHELRIQRSLQKLNVPDWYKNYAPQSASAAGTPSKSRDFGSGAGLAGGWPGLSTSKTSSLTSLQSAGRYTGSRTGFGSGRHRSTGTASTGGRSSRESLMSPSSTASASPSPYFERSSFTYGMPYALTRFAAARMSCGASPASLSPSPSPVGGIGSSTSTPVSSGPAARCGYQKQPYLGWRSQERLTSKTLYRSPAERLAADLIAQKAKPTTPVADVPPPTIEVRKTSPKKETASDLSLNNSEESNSHKLNRVRSSIKEVSNAIVDYVNETKPLDDGMNGRASPRRGLVWLESSFVGTKPIDSPSTPDTPSTFMSSHRGSRKDPTFRFDETVDRGKDAEMKSGESSSTSHYTSYITRNEQMEERSNSSSVSSPTLEDILDSLLALRRPNKKFRSRGKGHESTPEKTPNAGGGEPDVQYSSTTDEPISQRAQSRYQYQYEPSTTSEISSTPSSKHRYQVSTSSDWQDRMNQPLTDSTFTPGEPETFTLTGSRMCGNSVTTTTSPSSTTINTYSNTSSTEKTRQMDKYSASSGVTSGFGVTDSVVSSRSSSTIIHSTTSSLHSTPTHQKYQYHEQHEPTHYQSVASSRDYSSVLSGKSCIEFTPREDNELRQSLIRDEEELAFGNPTEIRSTVTSSTVAPITGSVIINPLTGLSEYSNPPTPARHRRVSFDLDFSDKEEKSSSRSRNKDETVGGTIQCRNTKCGKTATGLEARREFKVCHNCNAYYCSRECRRAHWEKHKKVCMQSRVGAICKQIINHVKEDSYVMNQLSTIAKRGFLAKGRGSVKLFFNSPDRAERFLTGGLPELPEPLYIPHSDMLPEEMGAQIFSELSDQCRSYNPESRFVLYTCVCVVNEVPTYGAVKWERELISRSSKLRLLLPRNFYEETQRSHHAPANPAHLMSALPDPSSGRSSPGLQPQQQNVPLYDSVTPSATSTSGDEFFAPPLPPHNIVSTASENETLILRSVPPPSTHQLNSSEHKRLRQVSFTNIQKHLLQRGVDLKRTYPEIFTKLCKYVEQDEPFLPVTIYPQNSQTGRQFVCIIMPESSDSAYSAATAESGQRHPLQRVETINISEHDDQDIT